MAHTSRLSPPSCSIKPWCLCFCSFIASCVSLSRPRRLSWPPVVSRRVCLSASLLMDVFVAGLQPENVALDTSCISLSAVMRARDLLKDVMRIPYHHNHPKVLLWSLKKTFATPTAPPPANLPFLNEIQTKLQHVRVPWLFLSSSLAYHLNAHIRSLI